MSHNVEYYLNLPYTILLRIAGDGWIVAIQELPGCMSYGSTPDEAVEAIQDAMRCWIEVSLEDGDSIPVPDRLNMVSCWLERHI